MIDEKYIDIITGYLQDSLNQDDQKKLDALIEAGKIDLQDINEMQIMVKGMDSIEPPVPSPSVRERFYTMLKQEKQSQSISWSKKLNMWIDDQKSRFEFRYAIYAVVVFLGGLFMGDLYAPLNNQGEQIDRLTSEVSQMREVMMINLLNNSSAADRLKAVNISTDIRTVDNRVVNALLSTLNNDSNVNVRISAVDALVAHASNPTVRTGLIQSITRQESPMVQAALADAMLTLQEKQSVDEFKKLLARDELDMNVRNKLENTLAALN